MTTEGRRIGLEEALRLSAAFSATSADGEVPEDLLVPVPTEREEEFSARSWGRIGDGEREAFRGFYQRVGEELEGPAARLREGRELEDAAWEEIARRVRTHG